MVTDTGRSHRDSTGSPLPRLAACDGDDRYAYRKDVLLDTSSRTGVASTRHVRNRGCDLGRASGHVATRSCRARPAGVWKFSRGSQPEAMEVANGQSIRETWCGRSRFGRVLREGAFKLVRRTPLVDKPRYKARDRVPWRTWHYKTASLETSSVVPILLEIFGQLWPSKIIDRCILHTGFAHDTL